MISHLHFLCITEQMLHKRSLSPLTGNENALRGYKVADEDKDKPDMGASVGGNRSLSDRDVMLAL